MRAKSTSYLLVKRPARRAGDTRRGSATLELVMCMPILLALIVGIVWLGASVIAQTEVTIEARHKTWLQRTETSSTALLFLQDDIASDSATQSVEISPLFDDAGDPQSSHHVMANAWDQKELPLDKAPNWKQYALAAANAKTGSVQVGYVDARNKLSQFKNQASEIWKRLGADLIRQLTGFGDVAKSILKGGQSEESAEKSKEESRLKRELANKQQELSQARKELNELGEDASEALRDVLKNRVKRLKADVANLKSDLKALK